MNIAYNMDCVDAMKDMPDNAFDLAVVDPPYGDALTNIDGGGKPWNRFGGRFDRYKTPVDKSGGWHGKQKYHLGTTQHLRGAEEVQHLSEPAEPGRRSSEKNHSVGCSTAEGVF